MHQTLSGPYACPIAVIAAGQEEYGRLEAKQNWSLERCISISCDFNASFDI